MKRLALLLVLAACPKHAEKKPNEPQVKHDASALPADAAQGSGAGSAMGSAAVVLPPSPPVPAVPNGLPAAPAHAEVTPDAVAFGALLFSDPALSADGKAACATCHDPAHGFAGKGVPALVNLAWVRDRDWPAYLPKHLANTLHGSVPHTPLYDAYKLDPIAALAAFVLTRYEGDSPWDRAERLPHPPADQAAGYKLFAGKAGCAHCHAPPLYTDLAPHDGARTPTLRGVAKRRSDLETAMMHKGADLALSPAEKSALVAFLQAL